MVSLIRDGMRKLTVESYFSLNFRHSQIRPSKFTAVEELLILLLLRSSALNFNQFFYEFA